MKRRGQGVSSRKVNEARALARDRSWGWEDPEEPVWDIPSDLRPDLPDAVPRLGELVGFVVQDLGRRGRSFGITSEPETLRACVRDDQFNLPDRLEKVFSFPRKESNGLVWGPPNEHLYVILDWPARKVLRRTLYRLAPEIYSLSLVSQACGGLHRNDRLRVDPRVAVLGRATFVIYGATKRGDGPTTYVHEFGEEGGTCPWLCIDRHGDLHLAGGDYTVPTGGIAD